MNERWAPIVLPVAVFALLALGWDSAVIWSGSRVFPRPFEVLTGLVELGQKGVLVRYVLTSLWRVSTGFGLALIVGLPLGLLIGWNRWASAALNPLIQVLRPISPIAWIPVSILWFGVSEAAPVFLIFLASLFPITTTAAAAVREIPLNTLRASKNLGIEGWDLVRLVVFPAVVPQLVTGVRIALGVAWMVVVAAEMIAVDSGLGYLIIDARNAGSRYDLVVAGMVLIGLIGLGLDLGLRWLEQSDAVRWGKRA